jgi:peptidoglycan-associated lipoprotein
MKRLAAALAVITMAACNPTTKPSTAASPDTNANANKPVAAQPAESQQAKDTSVYFEFAKSNIESQYTATIQDEVAALKAHKGEKVTLEGNTDERGSAEYNLGLGQRRADAVKKRMVAAGISARRLKTVSLGKEKPKASCHDESCWKENRRVDFVQQG